jgi:hypothetical protein
MLLPFLPVPALQVLDEGSIWILVPLTALAIPIFAILTQPFQARMKSMERERLRQMYERLAMEKLDVIKTAVTMGYQKNDLAELDERLEAVIGSAAMAKLLEGKQLGSGRDDSKVHVNLQAGVIINDKLDKARARAEADTVDLDRLISSELKEGLASRKRDRELE